MVFLEHCINDYPIGALFLQSKVNPKTLHQHEDAFQQCKALFDKKTLDYGTAWQIMRTASITDQIFIKAQRIRTIEENGKSLVGEGIIEEYIGIVNYAIMGIIQLKKEKDEEYSKEYVIEMHNHVYQEIKNLMIKKNTDYGEAWRKMRVSTFTDLILMKIKRTKQIEENLGKTIVSEGIESNYQDMVNYAIFALIRCSEK